MEILICLFLILFGTMFGVIGGLVIYTGLLSLYMILLTAGLLLFSEVLPFIFCVQNKKKNKIVIKFKTK